MESRVVSYSEIDTFRQCPLQHQLAYKERWREQPREGSARDKGTLWHSALELHYSAIREVQLQNDGRIAGDADEIASMIKARVEGILLHDRSGEPLSEVHDLVYWMYQGYVERYGIDPDWRILGVEVNREVPLLLPDGALSGFALKTKIDLVVRDLSLGNRVWVVDHKSGKDLPRRKSLDIDDQFSLYTLLLRRIGVPVFGQVYSAARTQRNKDQSRHPQPLDTRFERYLLYREDPELLVVEQDAINTMRLAYNSGIEGDMPASPSPDTCSWKCDFLEPHIMARKTGRSPSATVREFGMVQDFTRH